MITRSILDYLKPISKKTNLREQKHNFIGIDAQNWLLTALRLFLKEPLNSTNFDKIYNFFKSKLIEIFKLGKINQDPKFCWFSRVALTLF